MRAHSLTPMHGRANSGRQTVKPVHQSYTAYLPSQFIFNPSLPQQNIPSPNLPQQNPPQQNLPQQNLPQQNLPQPNPPQPNHLQLNLPQPNLPQPNLPQPNLPQPNLPQPNPPQPNHLQPNHLQLNLSQQPPCDSFGYQYHFAPMHPPASQSYQSPRFQYHQPVAVGRPPPQLLTPGQSSQSLLSNSTSHFATSRSKQVRSNKYTSSSEMPPKKRLRCSIPSAAMILLNMQHQSAETPSIALESGYVEQPRFQTVLQHSGERFEATSNMEMIFYDDIICHILSFLSLENISSSVRVSQTFAKNARKARTNIRSLEVDYMMPHNRDYAQSILTNCRKIKTLTLRLSTLSKSQIYSILEHCAGTMLDLDALRGRFICFNDARNGQPCHPHTCLDSFFGLLSADMFKNLRSICWGGCFQAADFLCFARARRNLEKCKISISSLHGLDIGIALKGVELILLRNPRLNYLLLRFFIGVEEILLKLPECRRLGTLCLMGCKISTQTMKRLAQKLPETYMESGEYDALGELIITKI